MPKSTYQLATKALFALPEETSHTIGLHMLELSARTPILGGEIRRQLRPHDASELSQTVLGKEFGSPVGPSAGLDKNFQYIESMYSVGFGFMVGGTVTPLPQGGNPRPRVFRYEEQESLQNWLGFNNQGQDAAMKRLLGWNYSRSSFPIGVSIGPNKSVLIGKDPIENTISHLVNSATLFSGVADFIEINLSSPNSPGLRTMQTSEFVTELFDRLKKSGVTIPIFVKVSPEAPGMSLNDIITTCKEAIGRGAAGIVATNTTIDYDGVGLPLKERKGGISGAVIHDKSRAVFREISKELYGNAVLVRVGGVSSAAQAYQAIKDGATLVELLTAFVFKGPSLPSQINSGLIDLVRKDNYENIEEARGSNLRK